MMPSAGTRKSRKKDLLWSTTIWSPERTGIVPAPLPGSVRLTTSSCCRPPLEPEHPDPVRSAILRGAAGPRHGLADAGLGTHGEDLRPGDLAGHGHPHQRLHHELRVGLELSQESAKVGLGGGVGHPGHLDQAEQRMGDRPVRRYDEIAAELGLAPHHDSNGIPRRQHRLRLPWRGLLCGGGKREHDGGEQEEGGQGSHKPRGRIGWWTGLRPDKCPKLRAY